MSFSEAQRLKIQKAFILGMLSSPDMDQDDSIVVYEAFKRVRALQEEAERKE